MSPTLELTIDLMRRVSVTPNDAGCQPLLGERLTKLGFQVTPLKFGDVDNLWAVLGDSGPILAFAGHTDVVPPGPEAQWRYGPFEPTIYRGLLYGRGAADMKGSLAAMLVAIERYVAAGKPREGRIAVLLTSDEEGPAVNGTVRVIEYLKEQKTRIKWCVIGEPSSDKKLGDTVRIGRRGSLNGNLRVSGQQGHVAYPDRARNAIHLALPALEELVRIRWDAGSDSFPPSSFQIANISAGTGAENMIPGECLIGFNMRFNTLHSADSLRKQIVDLLDRYDLDFSVDWKLNGAPFLTERAELAEAVERTVSSRLGITPEFSTGGGTSDGRFIAPSGSQVIELGPCNASIHRIDEHVRVDDLDTLTDVYEDLIGSLLGANAARAPAKNR